VRGGGTSLRRLGKLCLRESKIKARRLSTRGAATAVVSLLKYHDSKRKRSRLKESRKVGTAAITLLFPQLVRHRTLKRLRKDWRTIAEGKTEFQVREKQSSLIV